MSARVATNWLDYHLFLLFYASEKGKALQGLVTQLQVACINYGINSWPTLAKVLMPVNDI